MVELDFCKMILKKLGESSLANYDRFSNAAFFLAKQSETITSSLVIDCTSGNSKRVLWCAARIRRNIFQHETDLMAKVISTRVHNGFSVENTLRIIGESS
ncbi:hypothetical protein KAI12_03560 [Candidatus Bathyarchaeota archaeon]|nr:hypothetical protein [Candidatus Bathyarchaeota archaeon]